LRRDYFPRVATVHSAGLTNTAGVSSQPGVALTNAPAPSQLAARLAAKGLRLIDSAEARRLFEDPRRTQELVVFVDARNDAHYQEAHVPGAYQFDHYYPQNYLPTVLPVCQQAETIVVYCAGGDCEDSEFAALALTDAGVPAARLSVYGGGMAAWQTNGLPVEVGARSSGEVHAGSP
jgi:rhodanese-related sulfurtransferase